jgi:hypothetical protein
MSKSKRKKVDNPDKMNSDPLANLFQLDSEEMVALDEKALILMIKMLDNLEDFKDMSGNLQSIMEENEMLETRLLSFFKVLINGIQLEYKQLGYMP